MRWHLIIRSSGMAMMLALGLALATVGLTAQAGAFGSGTISERDPNATPPSSSVSEAPAPGPIYQPEATRPARSDGATDSSVVVTANGTDSDTAGAASEVDTSGPSVVSDVSDADSSGDLPVAGVSEDPAEVVDTTGSGATSIATSTTSTTSTSTSTTASAGSAGGGSTVVSALPSTGSGSPAASSTLGVFAMMLAALVAAGVAFVTLRRAYLPR